MTILLKAFVTIPISSVELTGRVDISKSPFATRLADMVSDLNGLITLVVSLNIRSVVVNMTTIIITLPATSNRPNAVTISR